MSQLPVYYETRSVGTIEVGADGPSFVYDPAWLSTKGAFPLSILMPLSTRPFKPAIFLPWAANLLPEGAQLKAIGSTLGAAPDDVIAILSEIGRDTAGALSIGKPGSANPGDWKPIKRPADLERILNDLPIKPFLAGDDGVSMSLAGVQSKLGVAIRRGIANKMPMLPLSSICHTLSPPSPSTNTLTLSPLSGSLRPSHSILTKRQSCTHAARAKAKRPHHAA